MRVSPHLRLATPNDLGLLFDLHRMVFRSHIEEIWGWREEWQRENFTRLFELSRTEVVEVGERTVGYVQTEREAHRLYLRNIALHPKVQGQGIGTVLMRQLQQESEKGGVPLELVLFRTNPRALEFYERLGFKETGRTSDFIEMSWHAA